MFLLNKIVLNFKIYLIVYHININKVGSRINKIKSIRKKKNTLQILIIIYNQMILVFHKIYNFKILIH